MLVHNIELNERPDGDLQPHSYDCKVILPISANIEEIANDIASIRTDEIGDEVACWKVKELQKEVQGSPSSDPEDDPNILYDEAGNMVQDSDGNTHYTFDVVALIKMDSITPDSQEFPFFTQLHAIVDEVGSVTEENIVWSYVEHKSGYSSDSRPVFPPMDPQVQELLRRQG